MAQPAIVIDYSPPAWADDRPQRVRRNEPRPQEPVLEREQNVAAREQFVDGSHVSLVPAASDDGVRRPLRAADASDGGVRRPLLGVDASPYKPRRKSVAAPATGGFSAHENNLAQLIRDLDQLLQAKKGA